MPIVYANEFDCADAIIQRVGKTLKVAVPLAAGKPVPILNALYRRAREDPELFLEIYTALTLAKPRGKSLLEKRFLEPFSERVFGDYPDPEFHLDREQDRLPPNVRVIEFYFPAGRQLNSRHSQENYVSSNYTHVARDLLDAGVNVIAQLVAVADSEKDFSLSCNPDTALDLMEALGGRDDVAFVAQVNRNLPFMYGDAVVPKESYDFVLDDPRHDHRIFAPPRMPVSDADHMIGLYGSTLIKDGGELQIGIGALGDALVYSMLMRHQDNNRYLEVLRALDIEGKFGTVVRKKGGTGTFQEGLFGATEMFVDSFMHLIDRGIMKRRVYDHVILQRLLNEGLITEEVTRDTLYKLIERHAVHPRLTPSDFRFLQKFGILDADMEYDNGYLQLADGSRVEADFNQEECVDRIFSRCLGRRLENGAIVHAAFFLGPQVFYDWLLEMPEAKRRLIHMKSVTSINQLYGHEELDRLHRKDARFVNTAMMITLFGGIVSDGLADGRVVSGVGGQFNFIAMSHALPDGHALMQLRSTREEKGHVHSSIVFNYGHITIPRHLRDIVITEYGIADIRGKTDSEVAAALIEVADSRFQEDLVRQAKRAGKLREDYRVPDAFRNNFPETIQAQMDGFRSQGLFPRLPFGTDFTDEELVLGRALKSLKKKSASKLKILSLLLKPAGRGDTAMLPYLRRMGLDAPKGLEERLFARLLRAELAQQE
ncbi:MAG: acetyl-CoA hydrolase/transferase C-terminal domain-containing protein [Pseudomonadota bacterium]